MEGHVARALRGWHSNVATGVVSFTFYSILSNKARRYIVKLYTNPRAILHMSDIYDPQSGPTYLSETVGDGCSATR